VGQAPALTTYTVVGFLRFLMPNQEMPAQCGHAFDEAQSGDGDFDNAGKDARGVAKARRGDHRPAHAISSCQNQC